jgi:hypothetical protein
MEKIPKVVMIGLLPNQQKILTETMPEISFRFIEADRKQFQLPKCSLVVIWARFISHRLSNSVTKQATSSVYIHRGGMSAMVAFLQNWNCKNGTGGK